MDIIYELSIPWVQKAWKYRAESNGSTFLVLCRHLLSICTISAGSSATGIQDTNISDDDDFFTGNLMNVAAEFDFLPH